MRHAHEAFVRIAREVARLRPGDLVAGGSVAGVGSAALATYAPTDSEEDEGRFDPRI
jgi:2-keto-4-pentenoate hydratase/2-oxohepta-3-ene-1,7-dioic acid hydratase in catechol pathway